ncbi:hypothetical protein ACFO3D_03440 [Virgibacillus kekensis]|uniref:Uncharacterized protein n=1 Tax=Virgibacillus kekensis TaxID=202261 RepID=A0ABV9DEQ1_9BACI
MEQKPIHYDGSGQTNSGNGDKEKPIEITDEMRKNIGGNPYEIR